MLYQLSYQVNTFMNATLLQLAGANIISLIYITRRFLEKFTFSLLSLENHGCLFKKNKMKVVLVGYMGSGKSTVGQLLATELNQVFLDLDTYIEEKEEMSISEIFETKGEIFFRKKEYQYIQELMHSDMSFVLSTGGGTPCYSGNMETMLTKTKNVFYLKVTIPELLKRLNDEKEKRPLIKDISEEDLPEFFGKHLFERNPYYAKATHTILCSDKTTEEIVADIKACLDYPK